MIGIVSNILHWYLSETPDIHELERLFGAEQFVAGEPTVHLLRKGLTVRTIGLFDPRQFLESGPRHLRETIRESWTAEQEEMFYATWTSDKTEYWQAKVRQWIKAYQAAGARRQQEFRHGGPEDIYNCLNTGGVAIVTWMLNPLDVTPALVYGMDENHSLEIYCPAWGIKDCFQARSYRDFSLRWKWNSDIHLVSR